MKITELRNKVPKGSQKRTKHPTATDDPDKYIGKWEKYDEPQGVNSPAAKKQMHAEGFGMGPGQRFAPSPWTPTGDLVHATDTEAIKQSKKAPKKLARKSAKAMAGKLKPQITPVREGFDFESLMERREQIDTSQYGGWIDPKGRVHHVEPYEHLSFIVNEGFSWYTDAFNAGWVRFITDHGTHIMNLQGHPKAIIKSRSVWYPTARRMSYINIETEGPDKTTTPLYQGDYQMPNDGPQLVQDMQSTLKQLMREAPEDYPPSNLNIDITNDEPVKKRKKPDARMDVVSKNVKKLSGGKKSNVTETIRRPFFADLTAEYEVTKRDQPVGRAVVENNVITELSVLDGAEGAYEGHILNALLGNIIREADRINANLSIQLVQGARSDLKDFLERFGFRHVQEGILRRNAGAVQPPSVPFSRGLDGEAPI